MRSAQDALGRMGNKIVSLSCRGGRSVAGGKGKLVVEACPKFWGTELDADKDKER